MALEWVPTEERKPSVGQMVIVADYDDDDDGFTGDIWNGDNWEIIPDSTWDLWLDGVAPIPPIPETPEE